MQGNLRQSQEQARNKLEHPVAYALISQTPYLPGVEKIAIDLTAKLPQFADRTLIGIHFPIGSNMVAGAIGNQLIQAGVRAEAQRG